MSKYIVFDASHISRIKNGKTKPSDPKDFSGNDPFNENMHRNLELYRLHVDAVRKNKTVSREAMQKAILERRFQ